MNSVLKEILETRQVFDGKNVIPLHSHMDEGEGALLSKVFEWVRPTISIEVGFAYGVSTLFICDALAKVNQPARHIVLDPSQSSVWRGIGLKNVIRAGYAGFVELREEGSEIALPQLLANKIVLDAALIDGWHTFDHALVDFFYINKMLRVGGVVVLDDASWPSVGKLVDHILTYGCYRVFDVPGPHLPFINARRLRRLTSYTRVREWPSAILARLRKSKWPSAIALEKIAPDDRNWNWYKSF